jgi:limonene-1,2-epoxide hydrolase
MGCTSSNNLNEFSNINDIRNSDNIKNEDIYNDYYGNEDTFIFTDCKSVSTTKLIKTNTINTGIIYNNPLAGFVIKTFGHVNNIKSKVFLNIMHKIKVDDQSLITVPIIKLENKSIDTFYYVYSVVISTNKLLHALQDKEERSIMCIDIINRINHIYNDTLLLKYKIPNITNGYVGKKLKLFVITGNDVHDTHFKPNENGKKIVKFVDENEINSENKVKIDNILLNVMKKKENEIIPIIRKENEIILNNEILENIELFKQINITQDSNKDFKKRRSSLTISSLTEHQNINGFLNVYDKKLTRWVKYFYDLKDGILTYFCSIKTKTIVGIIDLFGCTIDINYKTISTQFILKKDKDHIAPNQVNKHLYHRAGQSLIIEIIDDAERHLLLKNLNIHILTRNEPDNKELISNENKHENLQELIDHEIESFKEKEELLQSTISNEFLEKAKIFQNDDKKDTEDNKLPIIDIHNHEEAEHRKELMDYHEVHHNENKIIDTVEISKAPLIFIKKRESITISNLTNRENVTGFFYVYDENVTRWIKYYYTLIDGIITYYKDKISLIMIGIIDLYGCTIDSAYKNISTQFMINKQKDNASEDQENYKLHHLKGNNLFIEIIDDVDREKLLNNIKIHIVFRKYCS